jgi:hypothetical protein
MKIRRLHCVYALLSGAAWILGPAPAAAARNYNLNISSNNAEHCADLHARSNNGEVVQSNDSVTLSRGEVPILEMDDAAGRSVVSVRGWDRQEFSIETCKVAAAETRSGAEQLVRGIAINRNAGRISTTGPAPSAAGNDDGTWQVFFFIHAPRNGSFDIQTRNGPVSIDGISGNLKLRATNGPVSLNNCAGQIEAETANGPISFSCGGGDVRLNAQNGPISLSLSGEIWNGVKLEAHTVNGPVSIDIPETFRSGVRVETAGHSPFSCRIDACRTAFTDANTLQFNGSQDTIRVSTRNGPVSVGGGRSNRRVI